MKSLTSLDRLAVGVMLTFALLAAGIIFFGEQAGVRLRVDLPEGGEVSPMQVITFTFSEKIDPEITAEQITITPIHEGYLEWADTYSLRFVPLVPFEKGKTYNLTFNAGEISTSGREVKQKQSWQFQVREPRIAYLVVKAPQSAIWSVGADGSDPKQLTPEDIKVISFDAARNGEFIIFTSLNEKGGIDLWQVSRNGGDASVLLDCGGDRCTSPVIAPNSKKIAYSREAAGVSSNLPFGSPRIWVVDLETKTDNPVYSDQQIIGYNPSWSPDSNKLASFDGLSDFINMIDFETGDQFLFQSNTGGPVAWSPDSTRLLFTNFSQSENGVHTQVYMADLTTQESIPFIGEKDERDYAYYSMAWSSRADRAVLGFRSGEEQPSQILWVFDPSLLDGITIASDPEYSYSSPDWDPWGSALVFQQFKLRGQYEPEIGIWREDNTQSEVLIEGILPQWLP